MSDSASNTKLAQMFNTVRSKGGVYDATAEA